MKKPYVALLALSLFIGACSKKDNADTSMAFIVNGLVNTTVANYATVDIPTETLSIDYNSGAQGTVTLSITGMPAGLTDSFSVTAGTPSFSTLLFLKASGVTPGTYHLNLVLTGVSSVKTISFDVTVTGSIIPPSGMWTVNDTSFFYIKDTATWDGYIFHIYGMADTARNNEMGLDFDALPAMGKTEYTFTNDFPLSGTCNFYIRHNNRSFIQPKNGETSKVVVIRNSDNSFQVTVPTINADVIDTGSDRTVIGSATVGGTINVKSSNISGL